MKTLKVVFKREFCDRCHTLTHLYTTSSWVNKEGSFLVIQNQGNFRHDYNFLRNIRKFNEGMDV